jgi:hypothetical protein
MASLLPQVDTLQDMHLALAVKKRFTDIVQIKHQYWPAVCWVDYLDYWDEPRMTSKCVTQSSETVEHVHKPALTSNIMLHAYLPS